MSDHQPRVRAPYDASVARSALLRPLLPLAALTLALSGCGSSGTSDRPTAASAQVRQRHDGAPTPAPTASAPASPSPSSEPAPSASAHRSHAGRQAAPLAAAARPAALETHLLAAGDMPDLVPGPDGGWTVGSTGPEGSVSVGACQKTDLVTIGAVSAVRRTFVDPADSHGRSAVQVVARFADHRSAWRAHEVLRSWREDCEAEVGPLREVALEAGSGEHYRASWGDSPRRARTADLGIVAHGAYLSLVEVAAPSADYPDDRAPARTAVRRISRSFG